MQHPMYISKGKEKNEKGESNLGPMTDVAISKQLNASNAVFPPKIYWHNLVSQHFCYILKRNVFINSKFQ